MMRRPVRLTFVGVTLPGDRHVLLPVDLAYHLELAGFVRRDLDGLIAIDETVTDLMLAVPNVQIVR